MIRLIPRINICGNTTPASLGAAEDLVTTTDAGNYQLVIHENNRVAGEELEIEEQVRDDASGTYRTLEVYQSGSLAPAKPATCLRPVCVPASNWGYKVRIKQTGGTLRAYRWVLMRLDA